MLKNMNIIFVVCASVCLLIGCDTKVPLSGSRLNLDLMSNDNTYFKEDNGSAISDSNVVINQEYTQSILNSQHVYSPLNFSASPKLLWSVDLDYSNTKSRIIAASPVCAGGCVYCVDAGGILYSFDAKTGRLIWRTSTTLISKEDQIGCAIAFYDNKIIVTTSFAECLCFSSSDAKLLWRIKLPAVCKGDGLTIDKGKVYILCANSFLNVVNINDGSIFWTHNAVSVSPTLLGSASVAVHDGLVFVAYPSSEIFALMESSGTVIWQSMIKKYSLTHASQAVSHPRACPVVSNGVVFFTSANGYTVAFNAKTGDKMWDANFGRIQTPVVSGNSIYLFDGSSTLVCLNRDNGAKRWANVFDNKFQSWCSLTMTGNGLVVISHDGVMNFVSHTGNVKQSINLGGSVSCSPIIADSIMYILQDDGKLLAYK